MYYHGICSKTAVAPSMSTVFVLDTTMEAGEAMTSKKDIQETMEVAEVELKTVASEAMKMGIAALVIAGLEIAVLVTMQDMAAM